MYFVTPSGREMIKLCNYVHNIAEEIIQARQRKLVRAERIYIPSINVLLNMFRIRLYSSTCRRNGAKPGCHTSSCRNGGLGGGFWSTKMNQFDEAQCARKSP